MEHRNIHLPYVLQFVLGFENWNEKLISVTKSCFFFFFVVLENKIIDKVNITRMKSNIKKYTFVKPIHDACY